VQISPPFSPWKKPHVESGFKTFCTACFELLSGYIGHDVADQQADSREQELR
jgi:putative transposase